MQLVQSQHKASQLLADLEKKIVQGTSQKENKPLVCISLTEARLLKVSAKRRIRSRRRMAGPGVMRMDSYPQRYRRCIKRVQGESLDGNKRDKKKQR